FFGVPKPANVGIRPWASAIPRFKRRCSDRDGNTRSNSKAGRSGEGSCADCRTVLYASPNHKFENFNERYRLLTANRGVFGFDHHSAKTHAVLKETIPFA